LKPVHGLYAFHKGCRHGIPYVARHEARCLEPIALEGEAKGVRLLDGTEIEAKKIVISGVDIGQTIHRFIGREHVSRKIARRAANVRYDRGQLHWANVALHELPKYKAEDYDPDFVLCANKTLMVKDIEYLCRNWMAEIWLYGMSKYSALVSWEDTRWVPSKAAPGKHNVMMEDVTCPTRFFSEKEWLESVGKWSEHMIEQWQWYAPNMTRDKVMGVYDSTSYHVEKRNINMVDGTEDMGDQIASQMGRFRPTPELSGYRMPVKNMYYSSGGAHDGPGTRGTNGYTCYKVIAEDFGLRKIWEEKGRAC